MSDTSQGPGWWKSAGGKWYPPQPNRQMTPASEEPISDTDKLDEPAEIRVLRAIHEEMRLTRLTVQWLAFFGVLLLIFALLVAYGTVEITVVLPD